MIANNDSDSNQKICNLSATTSSELSTNTTNEYQLSVVAIVLWSTLYGTMMLAALFGNLGVCWLVMRRKQLQTVTNFFLSSTALADSHVIALNSVFNFIYNVMGNRWIFGTGFCYFVNFVPIGAVCASVFSVTVISVDRFVLVMFPMRQRIEKRTALSIILAIWLLALAIAFPQGYFSTTKCEDGRFVCYVDWPDDVTEMSYHIVFLMCTYWLPLAVLAIAYVIMGKRLGQNQGNIGHINETLIKRNRKNKKAVKMMVLVVVVFAIFWLPYQLFFVVTLLWPEILKHSWISHFYLGVFWLAMSHAVCNPIIYCWANPSGVSCVTSKWSTYGNPLLRQQDGAWGASLVESQRPAPKNLAYYCLASHHYMLGFSQRTSNRSLADDRTIHVPLTTL